jgi:hypothetical protein
MALEPPLIAELGGDAVVDGEIGIIGINMGNRIAPARNAKRGAGGRAGMTHRPAVEQFGVRLPYYALFAGLKARRLSP